MATKSKSKGKAKGKSTAKSKPDLGLVSGGGSATSSGKDPGKLKIPSIKFEGALVGDAKIESKHIAGMPPSAKRDFIKVTMWFPAGTDFRQFNRFKRASGNLVDGSMEPMAPELDLDDDNGG